MDIQANPLGLPFSLNARLDLDTSEDGLFRFLVSVVLLRALCHELRDWSKHHFQHNTTLDSNGKSLLEVSGEALDVSFTFLDESRSILHFGWIDASSQKDMSLPLVFLSVTATEPSVSTPLHPSRQARYGRCRTLHSCKRLPGNRTTSHNIQVQTGVGQVSLCVFSGVFTLRQDPTAIEQDCSHVFPLGIPVLKTVPIKDIAPLEQLLNIVTLPATICAASPGLSQVEQILVSIIVLCSQSLVCTDKLLEVRFKDPAPLP